MKLFSKMYLMPLVIILFSAQSIFACLCTGPIVPCLEYKNANTVFIGMVTKIEHPQKAKKNESLPASTIYFDVEKTYKGKHKAKNKATYVYETSCSWLNFKIGERWIVYGYGDENKLHIPFCSGTTIYSNKSASVKFLNDYPLGKTKEYILGQIVSDKEEKKDITISVKGNGKSYTTKPDDGGNYKIKVDRAGIYEVKVDVPFSAFPAFTSITQASKIKFTPPKENKTIYNWKTKIPKGLCSYDKLDIVYIDLKATASISGKVINQMGKSIPFLSIRLAKLANSEKDTLKKRLKWERTDQNGNFEFSSLREGKYKVVVNPDNFPKEDMPYLKTYFPSTPNFSKAKTIILKQGEDLEGLVLKMPKELIQRKVEGEVFWADGNPVFKENPSNKSEKYYRWISIYDSKGSYISKPNSFKFSDDGKFSLSLFEGFTYLIKAVATNSNGNRLHKFVKIKVDKNLKPLRIVLDQKGNGDAKKFLQKSKQN